MSTGSLAVVDLAPVGETWSDRQIAVVKSTVAKDATTEELSLFLYLCKQYGLDPFRGEIFFSKFQGKPTIITSRDGYLSVAQRHPDFLGLNSAAVCEGDDFSLDPANGSLTHRFGPKRGRVIGAWAMCKRRGRDAVITFASLEEYRGNSQPWQKYPSAMCCKVAEAAALKRQFGISGLVTREELDVHRDERADGAPALSADAITGEIIAPALPPQTHQEQAAERLLTDVEQRALATDVLKLGRDRGYAEADIYLWLKAYLVQVLGKQTRAEMTPSERDELIEAAKVADMSPDAGLAPADESEDAE